MKDVDELLKYLTLKKYRKVIKHVLLNLGKGDSFQFQLDSDSTKGEEWLYFRLASSDVTVKKIYICPERLIESNRLCEVLFKTYIDMVASGSKKSYEAAMLIHSMEGYGNKIVTDLLSQGVIDEKGNILSPNKDLRLDYVNIDEDGVERGLYHPDKNAKNIKNENDEENDEDNENENKTKDGRRSSFNIFDSLDDL